jgi:hypothetical protein
MAGRVAVAVLVLCGLAAGVLLWWLQVFGYADRLPEAAARDQRVTLADGSVVTLPVAAAEAMDGGASPRKYRACLTLAADAPAVAAMQPYPGAEPLVTPRWFGCFDAGAIAAALADGSAVAVLAEADRPWGFDRVMAVIGDRAYIWPQTNRCGQALFSGDPLPDGCAPPPEG